MHGVLLGHWFVEANFCLDMTDKNRVFANLGDFEAYMERILTSS